MTTHILHKTSPLRVLLILYGTPLLVLRLVFLVLRFVVLVCRTLPRLPKLLRWYRANRRR